MLNTFVSALCRQIVAGTRQSVQDFQVSPSIVQPSL